MLQFRFNLNVTAYRAAIAAGVPDWLTESLRLVRERMISSFYGPKSGRKGPVRQRSARGEVPASQTKRLERSISQPAMISPFKAQMIVAAPYAAILNNPAQLDRPFVEPAILAVFPKFKPAGAV